MFGKRLMSSVVLVVLALFLLLTGGGILALGMLILSLIAFRELTKACGVIDAGQKNNALEGVGVWGNNPVLPGSIWHKGSCLLDGNARCDFSGADVCLCVFLP